MVGDGGGMDGVGRGNGRIGEGLKYMEERGESRVWRDTVG
jgi:hypothetical protein